MSTINKLSALDTLNAGDQLAVYSTSNGDARRSSLSLLRDWFSANFTSVLASSYIKVTPVSVANLPSAVTAGAGARAFVSDATASTFASTVVGGGAINIPVYSDGTDWKVG